LNNHLIKHCQNLHTTIPWNVRLVWCSRLDHVHALVVVGGGGGGGMGHAGGVVGHRGCSGEGTLGVVSVGLGLHSPASGMISQPSGQNDRDLLPWDLARNRSNADSLLFQPSGPGQLEGGGGVYCLAD